MSDIAIKVDGLGKFYRLGEIGTGTISQDLNRWWARMRGKEDPFALVGESNDRTQKGKGNIVWAIKDIAFEVKKGEVLGIIGRNGAGKSTLLKLLSKVTRPSAGSIKIHGRIASLLEVGTGFHPELTGRENIFQNGAILGMTKAEIKSKFDEIVDFSGVERYIDTPVKRYSSGMYVRLAFAVAAHLEPEILIVDEVLAVGDVEFQKKCLGKMKDVSVNDGRTVLFVSHNLPAVRQLCDNALYLKFGELMAQAPVEIILDLYKIDSEDIDYKIDSNLENEFVKIESVNFFGKDGSKNLKIEDNIIISTNFECKIENRTLGFSYNIYNDEDILIFEAYAPFASNKDSDTKNYTVDIIIPGFLLNSGKYRASLIFAEAQKYILLSTDKIFTFSIEETFANVGNTLVKIPGIIRPNIKHVIR